MESLLRAPAYASCIGRFILMVAVILLVLPALGAEPRNGDWAILSPRDSSWRETLAAREVRRYLYLRTGRLFKIVGGSEGLGQTGIIVVARKDQRAIATATQESDHATLAALGPQQYWIRGRRDANQRPTVLVTGGDDLGTLYAAYRFAEHLGVRFYLHGDVMPDDPLLLQDAGPASAEETAKEATGLNLPDLNEVGRPLFPLRGIQPFHDFPEGPDWWNRDDYLGVLSQLPKLRLNFIGLHTYPEQRPNAEPTVWIGQTNDIGTNGQVHFAYSSSYQSTARGNWGYAAKKTSEYHLGASQLFESDDYGPDVMAGHLPEPTTPAGQRQVFERAAGMLNEAFVHARRLGVQTCVGTEIPLVIPQLLAERLRAGGQDPTNAAVVESLYEGIFRRAAQAYPIDYYWLWTPEGWNEQRRLAPAQIKLTTADLSAALRAYQTVRPSFRLALCGWVLGPPHNRALFDSVLPKEVAMSCLNGTVGESPVEGAFGTIEGRPKWAIPWLEDDKALTLPQLWVGRMRRDAFDARRYGCTGLIGLHWRTRGVGPTISALAQAAWDQKAWAPVVPLGQPLRLPGPAGGWPVQIFPPPKIATSGDPTVYQSVRENVSAYYVPASNGVCQVTLHFCEPLYQSIGQRIFSVKLQGKPVIEQLDIFARADRNRPLDFTFDQILVTNGWVDIEFVPQVEYPVIAALTVSGEGFSRQINCGGPAYQKYLADENKPPYPPVEDFYRDWARSQFGPEVAQAATGIFSGIDGHLPRSVGWVMGPGGLQPDPHPWSEVKQAYDFVERFAALQTKVRGRGNQARFDYWFHNFAYLRAVGELSCLLGEYIQGMTAVNKQGDPAEQKQLAWRTLIPLRIRAVRLLERIYDHLLATLGSPGELGTVMNWEQHCLPDVFIKPGEALETFLGEKLPVEAQLSKKYRGAPHLVVPSPRASFYVGEPLKLRVIILAPSPPIDAAVHWRRMGQGDFTKVPLAHVARGVYSAQWTGGQDDLEYYVKVAFSEGEPRYFPATAPALNQTMIAVPSTH